MAFVLQRLPEAKIPLQDRWKIYCRLPPAANMLLVFLELLRVFDSDCLVDHHEASSSAKHG
uniref:Uncharacterized protein n=1 Tax=Hyaloperonospora arabidopsidis (strain Emoy2) TaxID=559515 RepID=M4B4K5_HYAAE